MLFKTVMSAPPDPAVVGQVWRDMWWMRPEASSPAVTMLGGDDRLLPHIFVEDDLHMNYAGYDIWRNAVRPVLIGAQAAYE
ncbi:MAG: hypothetical protein QF921_03235 [Pseudomonadales bacterium]|nr:hypothetical protein [Acidiferrobacteraceae bacterium]MDP6375443.1 hypothetical protein [Pseudomonadales bacterium]MDP6470652.1 hypothetical protein [Pseudomonadales bacterium]MDP6970523.1 hypothetical protein [Pseudomonadales bacterium]